MVSYIRARNDAQKEERRRLLLEAARRLYERSGFAEVAIAGVAAEAGLAKGTVYLYFATKEELFLALLEEELWGWFDEVDLRLDRLKPADAQAGSRKVTGALLETLTPRTLLLKLLTVLHALLEQNIAEASAFRFKAGVLERVVGTGARLERLLPLPRGEGAQAILTLYALVVGLQQMANPAPAVARVLADPRLAPMRVDFAATLGRAARALLVGLCH